MKNSEMLDLKARFVIWAAANTERLLPWEEEQAKPFLTSPVLEKDRTEPKAAYEADRAQAAEVLYALYARGVLTQDEKDHACPFIKQYDPLHDYA